MKKAICILKFDGSRFIFLIRSELKQASQSCRYKFARKGAEPIPIPLGCLYTEEVINYQP